MPKNKPKEKTQILSIHGGMTFKNDKDYLQYLRERPIKLEKKIYWSEDYLTKKLGSGFEIIRPRMPLMDNAKYRDWKIYFERYFPYLQNNIILIGSSLGGIFLAKYLSENKFPKKILAVYLVCPPYDKSGLSEDLVGGFTLKPDLTMIEKSCPRVNLLFSRNDDVIPVAHAAKYARKLKKSKVIIYDHINGHFKVPVFPEIIKMIKADVASLKKEGSLKR